MAEAAVDDSIDERLPPDPPDPSRDSVDSSSDRLFRTGQIDEETNDFQPVIHKGHRSRRVVGFDDNDTTKMIDNMQHENNEVNGDTGDSVKEREIIFQVKFVIPRESGNNQKSNTVNIAEKHKSFISRFFEAAPGATISPSREDNG